MKRFTEAEARSIGEQIGIDWASSPFDVEQFRSGMNVELEHGLHDPRTDVTGDDPVTTGRSRSRTCTSFPTTTRVSKQWRSRRSSSTRSDLARRLARSSPTARFSSATSPLSFSRSWTSAALMRSASPSAIAFSLCCTAWSERVWLFWRTATMRNVTIVVAVLMISCHVSRLVSRK